MSNRKEMKKKFKDLIIIEHEGRVFELWGLIRNVHDRRQQYQFDHDYIQSLRNQIESPNQKAATEAKHALIYLNAFLMATLQGNFSHLKELGIEATNTLKKEIYNSRNAAQRDFVNTNSIFKEDINENSEGTSIGSAVEQRKNAKKLERKGKKKNGKK